MSLHIIVSSHGLYAQEALNTVAMIIGHAQDSVDIVSVLEGRSYEDCLEEIQSKHAKYDPEDETLILVDIYGGTPSKIASHLALTQSNIQVYSGFNLPLLLDLLITKPESIDRAKACIEATFSSSLIDINQKLEEVNNNADCFDSY